MTRTRTTPTARGQHTRPHPACGRLAPRRAGAFSLMEVLIALGIFALGLVAVAAVFPTAIAIQSETVRDLAGQRAVINARSTIQALARSSRTTPGTDYRVLTFKKTVNPLTNATTYSGTMAPFGEAAVPGTGRTGNPAGVQPMIDQPMLWGAAAHGLKMTTDMPPVALLQLNAPRSFHDLFSLDTRSYPKNIADPYKRDYYWYPFIQARDLTGSAPTGTTSTWRIFLMVMQRRGTEAVPEARAVAAALDPATNNRLLLASSGTYSIDNDEDDDGLPDLIQPGDYVLGDDGSIFRVVVAEKNALTVDSQIPVGTNLGLLYYAVALDRTDPVNPITKRESRSAIVRIEQFDIVVNEP